MKMEEYLTPTPRLDGESQPAYSWEPSQDEVWGRLFAINQNLQSYVMTMDKAKITCGRGHCDIDITKSNLDETTCLAISKQHFVLTCNIIDGGIVVSLLDVSANGTFVNRMKIGKNKKIVLKSGDVIGMLNKDFIGYLYVEAGSCGSNILLDDLNINPPDELKKRYVIYKQLGSGTYGVVFHIFDKNTCKPYALKIMTKNKFPNMDERKIKNESAILTNVNHVGIVKLHEVIDDDYATYFFLELMQGGELYKKIKTNNKLTEETTKLYFYQIAQAVQYLHTNKISHRDLKPDNILLSSSDDVCIVKLCDFGLSRFVDSESFMKTQCGTPLYVAPEILKERIVYTNKVDIWSLGVILYVCLSGVAPFGQKKMKEAILKGRYSFPKTYWEDVSNDAIDLVRHMLTVDPEKRYSCEEVLQHRWLQDSEMLKEYSTLMRLEVGGPISSSEISDEETSSIESNTREHSTASRDLGDDTSTSSNVSSNSKRDSSKRPPELEQIPEGMITRSAKKIKIKL